jgi:2,5-diketo-D-gluconate reductase A
VFSIQEALSSAGLEYVDLLLVHAPIDVQNRVDHWKALEEAKQDGLAKSIGLAYMTTVQLGDFIKNCTVIPAVLEVLYMYIIIISDYIRFCACHISYGMSNLLN